MDDRLGARGVIRFLCELGIVFLAGMLYAIVRHYWPDPPGD